MSLSEEIASHWPQLTYSQIARQFGLTKGSVAGHISRYRSPTSGPGQGYRSEPKRPTWGPILELLSDGRWRTTEEIGRATGVLKNTAFKTLSKMEKYGLVENEAADGVHRNLGLAWREVE